MKRQWMSVSFVFVLLFTLLVGSQGTLASQESPILTPSNINKSQCETCDFYTPQLGLVSLAADNGILQSLQEEDQLVTLQQNFGKVLWRNASLYLPEENQGHIVVAPIIGSTENTADEIRFLLAVTEDGNIFQIIVLGISLEQPGEARSTCGGSMAFYAPDGSELVTADFVEGKITNINISDQPMITGLNWGCFGDCLLSLGLDFLPVCVSACSLCASFPNPYNPGCGACAACIGGSAITCIFACWE